MATDRMEPEDLVTIYECSAGNGDGADLLFDLNGRRIYVLFFPSPSSIQDSALRDQCIEDSIIRRLSQAMRANPEESEEIEYEVLDIVLDVGKAVLSELAPRNKTDFQPLPQDLHSLLYPSTLSFRLVTRESEPLLVPIRPSEGYSFLEPTSDNFFIPSLELEDSLSQYSTRQLCVLETFLISSGDMVARVSVDDKEMLCKAQRAPFSEVGREVESLQKIRTVWSPDQAPIRVPRILGYVKHPEVDCVVGFVREWIPGDCLGDIDIASTSEERRRKWASQISDAVHRLHEIDVIWGDGKARNIIIDDHDDAWLIDFAGGYTMGWVEKDVAGTLEGDEQAVAKIKEFLGIEL
ncbi:hypothetical protein F5Y18DRAFT_394700 [Xylariaceae sp. FL1019]|nr:hypothetical protein F5Y18DRAFT_394700 [Xylariaceae sp. FL1019]